jgi:hypothetical protein
MLATHALLALAFLIFGTVPASSQQQHRGREHVDLAFISPAGGSALHAGREFSLAIQVVASSSTICNLFLNIPTFPFLCPISLSRHAPSFALSGSTSHTPAAAASSSAASCSPTTPQLCARRHCPPHILKHNR